MSVGYPIHEASEEVYRLEELTTRSDVWTTCRMALTNAANSLNENARKRTS